MRAGPLECFALAGIVLVVVGVGLVACLGPQERIVFLLYDDAYYYLGVARHLAAGQGSTFDGLNPTNGYHPLWCWLLVPVVAAVRDPGEAVRAVGLLWFALAAAVPVAMWWVIRPRTGAAGALLAAALAGLQPHLPLGLARPNGLETPLYALALLALAGAWERTLGRGSPRGSAGSDAAATGSVPSPLRTALLGALLGGAILARLDAGAVAVAAAAMLLVHVLRAGTRGGSSQPRSGRAVRWRLVVGHVALLAASASAVAGPSLAWNAVAFGHPVPVSGRVVSGESERERARLGGALSLVHLRHRAAVAIRDVPRELAKGAVEESPLARPVRRLGTVAALALWAAVLAVAAAALAARRRRGETTSDAVVLLLAGAAAHGAVYAGWLWTSGEARYRLYYFLPQVLALAAAAGAALGPPLARAVRSRAARAALLLAGIGLLAARLVQASLVRMEEAGSDPRPVADRYVYGWARDTLPHDAVLGARDAGRLGWFVPQPVVNLDGLINDQRMLAALRDRREADYLAASPIRYVLVDRPWLYGFDPDRSGPPPTEREGLGEALWQLARRPGFALRTVPGATEDWVVVEIVRSAKGPLPETHRRALAGGPPPGGPLPPRR